MWVGLEDGECDLGAGEGFGDGAACLGSFGVLLEGGGVHAGDVAFEFEFDAGNREAGAVFFEVDFGGGFE